MLSNYFTIAWRNLSKNKGFSFINILGLSLGMACSLFIFLWIQDEVSIDAFHKEGERLYQLREVQYYDNDKTLDTYSTPGILAEYIRKEVPEVTHSLAITWEHDLLFRAGEKSGKEKGRYASSDIFEMLSFPLIEGNSKTVLSSPDQVVISRRVAEKYFGQQNPINKIIHIDNRKDFKVSGVFENIQENSSLKFDYLLPYQDFEQQNAWTKEWTSNGPHTLIMLHPDASWEKVDQKLRNYLISKREKEASKIELFLQPYSERYLHSRFENGKPTGGRIEYVRLFSIVTIFILLIACVNFMNLATARSVKRSKEVGIRKVVGADKRFLIGQFMGEAIMTTFISLAVALLMVVLFLPTFNSLTEKHISLQIASPSFWFTLLALALLTGLISGSYPALFLSSLNPITILKGSLKFKPEALLFRKALVVFQFTLSIILIVGTTIVYRQIQYIQNKNLGLDRENVIYVPIEGTVAKNFETFKTNLLQSSAIQSVSTSTQIPTEMRSSTSGVEWAGKNPKDNIPFANTDISYDFIKTMKIKLKDGRDFSKEFGTDTANYLINEEATKRMGMKNPVGQDLTMWDRKGKIVGLMENFHLQSLHVAIEPLIFRLDAHPAFGQIVVRTQPGKTQQALVELERISKVYNPEYPFSYEFADATFQKQYKSEMVIGKLANCFAFLGVFISCLGLFGLAMFTAEQRTKEIGIRKVLGASVTNIVAMLSQDFLKLVLLAFVIATPLAWWSLSQWLQNFVYRTDLHWWIFALAGILALCIALLTISFQSIKAAIANPVKSLRSE
ncbi:ABC transporter permease [Cytophagaceae bacterium DM2B3-1]|uniref:ABC transporter permease n=1 Tax=Xanthocytophaga flava TaxID=3048013 RepID=A0ABT7CGE9_9BACT|nr:ABC transporter permease [Xanthocytophaga flavus]MDJ1492591.1 ABC transporter permease [Xanthocytophaga flavus]